MACKIELYARKHMLSLISEGCDLVTTFSRMEGQRTAIVDELHPQPERSASCEASASATTNRCILEAQNDTQGAWNPMHFNGFARDIAHGSVCTNATRYVLA